MNNPYSGGWRYGGGTSNDALAGITNQGIDPEFLKKVAAMGLLGRHYVHTPRQRQPNEATPPIYRWSEQPVYVPGRDNVFQQERRPVCRA